MVRDEIDVLPYTLAHLDTQGLDGIIVADNLSEDGTWEFLCDLDLDTELVLLRDTEVGYYQSRKMTKLAYDAFAKGARWVIPFDADELWLSRTGTLGEAIVRTRPATDYLYVSLYNYFPRIADDPDEPNPFRRIQFRDPERAPLPKVIVHNRPGLIIEQGNHGVHADTYLQCESAPELEIGHFPWRGYEQFERKIFNGYQAYKATDLPETVGAHWRNYGRLLEEGGADALRAWYEKWFQDPPIELLEHHPIL
jgi:hypothetical protein